MYSSIYARYGSVSSGNRPPGEVYFWGGRSNATGFLVGQMGRCVLGLHGMFTTSWDIPFGLHGVS
jgi:hypothetical protein